MRFLLKLLFWLFIIAVLAGIAYGIYRTIKAQHDTWQQEFLSGKVPAQSPDGFYRGSIREMSVSWQGKKFDAAHQTGINVIKKDGTTYDAYRFITHPGKGLRDGNDVLVIDYNIAGNPFWLKRIVDEIVEVAPGKYLGKVHVKIIPGYPFAMGFFRLEKDSEESKDAKDSKEVR